MVVQPVSRLLTLSEYKLPTHSEALLNCLGSLPETSQTAQYFSLQNFQNITLGVCLFEV